MSAEVRQAIADAANLIGDVNVTPYFRQTTKAFEGMVRLDRITRDTSGFGYMATWQLWVLLPKDQETAERWVDDNAGDLRAAVAKELNTVTSVTPSQLIFGDGSTVPGVVIEGTREED